MGSSVSDSRHDKTLQKAYQEEASDSDEEDNNSSSTAADQSSFFSECEIVSTQKFKNKQSITFRYRIIEKCENLIGCLGTVFKCSESVEGISSNRERMVLVKKLKYLPDLQNGMEINRNLLEECLEMHGRHVGRVLNCFRIEQQGLFHWFIVSEYYTLGSLKDVRKSLDDVSVSLVLQVIFQMVSSLRFLNLRNLVHRNVKMENILVKECQVDRLQIVLGDLGSICQINGDSMEIPLTSTSTFENSDSGIDPSIIGTLGYRDPLSINKRRIHIKSDIWSLGVLLLKFIFFSDFPSSVNLEQESQENIEELLDYLFSPLELKDAVWGNIKQLVDAMLRTSVHERFGTSQILGLIFENIEYLSYENFESNYSVLKPVFKCHESVISTVLSRNGLNLQIMSDFVRKNKVLVLRALKNNAFSYEYISETLKNDSEILIETYSRDKRIKSFLARKLTTEEESQFKKNPIERLRIDRNLSEKERNDFSFISSLVSIDGKLLEFASNNLRNNQEIVKKSLLSNGLALEFASLELRRVRELVDIAIDQNPMSLIFADRNLKNNFEIVKKAVFQNGLALEFASPQLKSNKEIVKIAVIQNCKSLAFISPSLIYNDPEFTCSLLSYDSDSLEEYEKYWIETFDIFHWISCQFRFNSKCVLYRNVDLLVMYCILEENDWIQVEYKTILDCYIESSNKKHPYALYKMGLMYFHGDSDMGIETNVNMAVQYFEQSAQFGYVDALTTLYSIYSSSDFVNRDIKKAAHYLQNAALQGNAQSQWNLCELYAKGEGVPKSNELSFKWMKKSAQGGNIDAQLSLVDYYQQSPSKDDILSFEWCYKAALQDSPEAHLQFGEKLMHGNGCKINLPLACQYFEKSAQEGQVISMLNLGLIYFQSPQLLNLEKSLTWLLKASENGNIDAQHNIGYYYFSKQEYDKAFLWYMKSHLNGHENSFTEIAQMILRDELKFKDKKISGFLAKEVLLGRNEAITLLQQLQDHVIPINGQ